jgi:hypothetical protein
MECQKGEVNGGGAGSWSFGFAREKATVAVYGQVATARLRISDVSHRCPQLEQLFWQKGVPRLSTITVQVGLESEMGSIIFIMIV